jgi:hypothetical protein
MTPSEATDGATPPSPTKPRQPPRLLDQLRQAARQEGHAPPVVERHADWARRYILFHDKRHPRDLAATDVLRFLRHVAATEADALRSLEQAHAALTFLYRDVLGIDLGDVPLPPPPRLLDQIRQVARVRHYSPRTEDCYVQWATRYILFHGKRHPRNMGAAEIERKKKGTRTVSFPWQTPESGPPRPASENGPRPLFSP